MRHFPDGNVVVLLLIKLKHVTCLCRSFLFGMPVLRLNLLSFCKENKQKYVAATLTVIYTCKVIDLPSTLHRAMPVVLVPWSQREAA
jgi:hypothetical protein